MATPSVNAVGAQENPTIIGLLRECGVDAISALSIEPEAAKYYDIYSRFNKTAEAKTFTEAFNQLKDMVALCVERTEFLHKLKLFYSQESAVGILFDYEILMLDLIDKKAEAQKSDAWQKRFALEKTPATPLKYLSINALLYQAGLDTVTASRVENEALALYNASARFRELAGAGMDKDAVNTVDIGGPAKELLKSVKKYIGVDKANAVMDKYHEIIERSLNTNGTDIEVGTDSGKWRYRAHPLGEVVAR